MSEEFKPIPGGIVYNKIRDTGIPLNIDNREIDMPQGETFAVYQDSNSQMISIIIDRYYDTVDLSEKTISIKYRNEDGEGDRSPAVNVEVNDTKLRLCWLINSKVTKKAGQITFAVEFIGKDEKGDFYSWNTKPAYLAVEETLNIDGEIPEPDPTWLQQWSIDADEITKEVNKSLGEITEIRDGMVGLQTEFVRQTQIQITSDSEADYEVYDGSVIAGGLAADGTDANAANYARTEYLALNTSNMMSKTIKVYGLPSNYSRNFFFLYKVKGELGVRATATYNVADQSWGLTYDGYYNYLRFNVASPSWSLTGAVSVMVTPDPDRFLINDTDIDQRYLSKNYQEYIDIKQPRPDTGIVHFAVSVNVYQSDTDGKTTAVQDGATMLEDNAVLFLPENYSESGNPIRLVISCHGAGTTISPSTTSLSNPVPNLIKLGYAVLDCNGRPEGHTGSAGLHFGAPFALQSYIKAYQYVVSNYNIKRDVFVIGTSMGGLTSNMIVQSGCVPVLAQGSFCGVVDHFKQAYCNPWSSGQRKQIAEFFDFKGAAPAWTATGAPTQAEIDYYKANIDRVIGYSPMLKYTYNWSIDMLDNIGDAAEESDYNKLVKYHPVPLKIWHNADDTTVVPRYSKYYADAIRRAGGLAYYREFPSGAHNAWDNGATGTLKDVNGANMTVKASTYELYQWFKRFEI